jgi:hypothetical protein
MRLPMCRIGYWRTQVIAALNTMNTASPMPMTVKVFKVWCATTLSMTTWVNNGVAKAINWMAAEASGTSRNTLRCLSSSGMNQRKPKESRAAPCASGSASGLVFGVACRTRPA